MKGESTGLVSQNMDIKKHVQEFYNQGLYEDLDKSRFILGTNKLR